MRMHTCTRSLHLLDIEGCLILRMPACALFNHGSHDPRRHLEAAEQLSRAFEGRYEMYVFALDGEGAVTGRLLVGVTSQGCLLHPCCCICLHLACLQGSLGRPGTAWQYCMGWWPCGGLQQT